MSKSNIDMTAWGLTERVKTLSLEFPGLSVGRVVSQEKNTYRIIHEHGEQEASVSGKFRYDTAIASDYPTVGDFVMLDEGDGSGQAVIHSVLPRKSVFIRKAAGPTKSGQLIAANADLVFLCMSLNNDFNLRRLERYLAIAWESGAVPVIILTKADLCGNIDEKRRAVESVAIGVDVLVTSSLEKEGCESIRPYLVSERTIAFIGSSGVGKSTLINRLLGEENLKTNGLRNDDKGRHTTTHRELFLIPEGGSVIDTPGMRELGLWGAEEGLEKVFDDIEKLALSCKYKNCTHTTEPGCAVRTAIEEESLSEKRFLSYQKLKAENDYIEDGENYIAAKKLKFKEISKTNKHRNKGGFNTFGI